MDPTIIYNGNEFRFDLALRNGDLAMDDGLLPAVLVSLFTDRRAAADDRLPTNDGDRRGSWQDQYQDISGDLPGSRLWLLSREKQLPDVLARARTYSEEALAWLITDGLARSVSVPAEWVSTGVLGLPINITLIDGSRFAAVINYPLEG